MGVSRRRLRLEIEELVTWGRLGDLDGLPAALERSLPTPRSPGDGGGDTIGDRVAAAIQAALPPSSRPGGGP